MITERAVKRNTSTPLETTILVAAIQTHTQSSKHCNNTNIIEGANQKTTVYTIIPQRWVCDEKTMLQHM